MGCRTSDCLIRVQGHPVQARKRCAGVHPPEPSESRCGRHWGTDSGADKSGGDWYAYCVDTSIIFCYYGTPACVESVHLPVASKRIDKIKEKIGVLFYWGLVGYNVVFCTYSSLLPYMSLKTRRPELILSVRDRLNPRRCHVDGLDKTLYHRPGST